MYTHKRIDLAGLPNTRDLGGYASADGRTIKPHMLLRSGALAKATNEDISRLTDEYRLKTVVDFRTETERAMNPDPEIPGVKYYHIPALNESIIGIDRDETDPANTMVHAMMAMLAKGKSATDYMTYMYGNLITSVTANEAYGRFFKILLENEDGSVLWHCSAGKDRAGTATILTLEALGIPSSTVRRDYLLTNEYVAAARDEDIRRAMRQTDRREVHEFVYGLSIVAEEYIDSIYNAMEEKFGSVEGYFKDALDIDRDALNELRNKYLK